MSTLSSLRRTKWGGLAQDGGGDGGRTFGDGLVPSRAEETATEVSTAFINISSLPPRARTEGVPAQVDRGGHVGRLVPERSVDQARVLLGQLLDILSTLDGSGAHLVGAQVGEVGIVELDVLALRGALVDPLGGEERGTYTCGGEGSDLGAVDGCEVLEEVIEVGVCDEVRTRSSLKLERTSVQEEMSIAARPPRK